MKRLLLHTLIAFTIAHTPTVSYARGGGNGYGGMEERVEIDPAVTQRLGERIKTLGYDGWLELNGVYKPDPSEARIKIVENGVLLKPIRAEVNVEYRVGDGNRFAPSDNRDAYFGKIVLMTARLLNVEVDTVMLSVSNIGCHHRFRSGRFVNRGGCGGRDFGSGAPIMGLVNDIHGTLREGESLRKVASRIERFFNKLNGKTSVRVKDGNILVDVSGLRNTVVAGGDRLETVTVYLVRSVGGVRSEGGSEGETVTVEYLPKYHIITDGGYVAGKDPKTAPFEPFEPAHFPELDALAKRVKAVVQDGA
jgi:hypothetical protein